MFSSQFISIRKTYFKQVDKVLVGLCKSQQISTSAVVAKSKSVDVRTEYPDFSAKTEATGFNATCNDCATNPATYYVGES